MKLGALKTFLALIGLAGTLTACETTSSRYDDDLARSSYASFLAARYAGSSRDVTRSAEFYEQALSSEPGSGFLSERVFLSSLMAGDFTRADRYVEGAAAEGDITALALAYLRAARLAGARLREPEGAELGADLFSAMIESMLFDWSLVKAGQGMDAASQFARVQAGSTTGYLMVHRALLLEAVGDFSGAEQSYQTAVETLNMPDFTTELYGAYLERRGRVEQAGRLYKQRLERRREPDPVILAAQRRIEAGGPAPRFPSPAEAAARAMFAPSALLISQAPPDYAVLYLRMIERLDPGFSRNQVTLAAMLNDLEMHDLAIEAYQSVASGPFASQAEIQALWLNYREGEAELVREEVVRLVEQDERSESLRLLLADMLRVSGDCAGAIEIYDDVIAQRRIADEPADWRHSFFAGLCVQDIEDWSRAERYFLRALDLAPNNAMVLNHLGYFWIVRGERMQEGFDLVRRAVERDPENGNIIDSLGWGYFKQANYDQAVFWLEQAVEKEPSNGTINWHLGDAYAAVGRQLEAMFQWRRAIELDDLSDEETSLVQRRLELGLDAGPVDIE